MKTTIEIDVKDWITPDFVLLNTPVGPAGEQVGCLPLHMIDADTLDTLCERFRADVFKKAKKPQPPRAA